MRSRKSRKRNRNNIVEEVARHSDWWPLALLIITALLLFYPSLFGGLFADNRMFISHIITALVFSVVLVNRVRHGKLEVIRTPLDWAVLAYAAAYLLSLIGAVVPGEAVYGFLKALNYFMVYWVVTRVVKDYDQVRLIIKVLLTNGVVVALIGILTAAGLLKFPGAFTQGHIMSTLQYHNTMAAYLSVLILLGVAMMLREKSLWLRLIYGAANYIMIVAVLGAISKGAWIILIGGALLLLIGMPGIYRLKSLYYLGIAIGPSLVLNSSFMASLDSASPSSSLVYVGLGVLLALGGVSIWEGAVRIWGQRQWSPTKAALVALVLLGLTVIILGTQVTLPDNISKELSEIADINDSSYVTRVDFARWGIEIIKNYPMVGTGAGGWEALYRQYQHYVFWTTQTHNHFIQVGVETGLIGLLAFISIWIVLLYSVFRIYRLSKEDEEPDHWIIAWGITSGTLAMVTHAAFDFDLSIPAMCMVLWTMVALTGVLYDLRINNDADDSVPEPYKWLQVAVAGVLVLILLISGGRYLQAFHQAKQGEIALQSWQSGVTNTDRLAGLEKASAHFAAAVKNDSSNALYWSQLAGIQKIFFLLLNDQQHAQADVYRQQCIEAMKQAASRNPYDPRILESLVQISGEIGYLEGTIEYGWMDIKSRPNDPGVYKKIGDLWWQATRKCMEADQEDMAIKFAEEVIELNHYLEGQLTRADTSNRFWQKERLKMTPAQEKLSIQAKEFLANNS